MGIDMWTLISGKLKSFLNPAAVNRHRSQITGFLAGLSTVEFEQTQQAYREIGRILEAESLFRNKEEVDRVKS